ncbi:hypothetical protein [Rossellomorea sp. KS-H15a]|nr:hypothetical protein [Rossellomorea sp. KS-H15a]
MYHLMPSKELFMKAPDPWRIMLALALSSAKQSTSDFKDQF